MIYKPGLSTLLLPAFIILLSVSALAEDYRVGSGEAYETLGAVAGRLRAGDRVFIETGTYREVMKITAKGTASQPILIQGTGKTKPVFDAEGLDVSGRGSVPRAIFQVEGSHIIIENLELKNARNGNNGAGIRLNQSENLTIRNCTIHHCDMGIQGGDRNVVTIEDCDIGFNSTTEHNGYSHNFYMLGNGVVVQRCYIHDSLYGQNFKSRAHYNELWNNWIVDSNEGEVGPVDGKGDTDRPNSNVLMVGNVIVSKNNRTGNSAKYVLMGSESGGSHDGTLFMFYNVLIAGDPKVQFIQLDDPKTHAVINYNLFYGSNQIVTRHHPESQFKGTGNWIPQSASLPKGFSNTLQGQAPGFHDLTNRDFRLLPDSELWKYSSQRVEYVDGDGVEHAVIIDLKEIQEGWRHEPESMKMNWKIH